MYHIGAELETTDCGHSPVWGFAGLFEKLCLECGLFRRFEEWGRQFPGTYFRSLLPHNGQQRIAASQFDLEIHKHVEIPQPLRPYRLSCLHGCLLVEG